MRIWKQPISVWFFGIAASIAAASVEAAPDDKRLDVQPPKDTRKVEAVDLQGAGKITPAPMLKAEDERAARNVPHPADATPAAASNDMFSEKMANLWRCKFQVAMEQRKSPAQVPAGKVAVRFEVDRSGNTVQPTVVALEPAAPEVLTCVTREIQGWQVSPAPAERMKVDAEVEISGPKARREQGMTDTKQRAPIAAATR